MDNTFIDPSISFLIAGILGFAISLIYDVFRIIRLFAKPMAAIIFVEDIIFSFIYAILTFGLLIVRCQGQIRWFIFVGELSGFILCRFTLSMLIISVADKIIKLIRFIISLRSEEH